jgi:hypothetical protein
MVVLNDETGREILGEIMLKSRMNRTAQWIVVAMSLTHSWCVNAENISLAQRESAVKETAQAAPECRRLGDFYWEIGDAKHVIASQSIGTTYSSDKSIHIASASKWIFGSYVLEKIGKHSEPAIEQLRALEMQSGYTSLKFGACIFARTVADCFNRRENAQFTPGAVGQFFYNGGHDQKLAIDLGLGNLNAAQFGAEIRKYLGEDIDIDFNSPQPAGGGRASPDAYGKFLRKILSGELRMKDYLGSNPVCTLPGVCANAIESPVPVAWHYSLNHWIEDDPENGDGAFSSPGAFGFYPWISADKHWYGILARDSRKPLAYKESVYCGGKLRKAWVTGMPK